MDTIQANTKEHKVSILRNELDILRQTKGLRLSAVVGWFEKNFNRLHAAVHFVEGRPANYVIARDTLFSDGSSATLSLTMTIYYVPDVSGSQLDLTGIGKCFPEFSMNVLHHDYSSFTLEVQLALDKWKTLAPSLLSKHIYTAYLENSISEATRNESLAAIEILIAAVYPELTLDLIHTFAQLGLVDKDPGVFAEWLADYMSTREQNAHVELPTHF